MATWWPLRRAATGAAPPPGAETPALVSPPAMTSLPGEGRQVPGDQVTCHVQV